MSAARRAWWRTISTARRRSVGSLLNTPPTKVIGVTPARVIDSAQEGTSAPQSAALVLSTAHGDAPPPWTARKAKNAAWLTIAAPGSAPDTLHLALNPSSLPPGVYRDTVVIVPVSSQPPEIWPLRLPVDIGAKRKQRGRWLGFC